MLDLNSILPNLKSGLAGTGFLFGAGTSVEAGYPMMPALTREVVSALSSDELGQLLEVLASHSLSYNSVAGTPNIEVLADLVISHALNSGDSRFSLLEARLRDLVSDVILSVDNPHMDHHVRFMTGLKSRAFGQPACVYIFTTNYDCLFELAAAEAGVVVETGFSGSVERFFDHGRFSTSCGTRNAGRFEEHPALTIRLVKLHGSISWLARNGRVYERHPDAISKSERRVMILPRRRKVMDTLQSPHDVLFGVVSRALGVECKYIVSCGFSYGDAHINDNLLIPSVALGRVKLFALSEFVSDGMQPLRSPAFSAGFSDSMIVGGQDGEGATDLWRFGRFASLFG